MSPLVLCLLLLQDGTQQLPIADALVTGRVLDGASGKAVPAATVTLLFPGANRNASLRVLTDDDGRFFFDRLLAGRYALNVTKPGWINGAFGRYRPEGSASNLEIAEHERRPNADIKMWKYAVLSGTVVDDAGEPMIDVQVRAVRRAIVAGRRRMTFAGTARTDDRGMYRLAGLVPGDYSVFVPATVSSGALTFSGGGAPPEWLKTMTGDGTAPMGFSFESGVAARNSTNVVSSLVGASSAPSVESPWLAIPPTFAGTADASGAATFALVSGQERRGVDMQLRMVPTYSVSGTLIAPGETPANFALHLMPSDLADFPLFDVALATSDASGVFTFFGVPQGDYVIRVVRTPMAAGQQFGLATFAGGEMRVSRFGGGPGSGPPALPTEPLLHATERISVADRPVRGLQIIMRAGPRITGRAEFVGITPPPTGAQWGQAYVLPERASGYRPADPPQGFFNAEGVFGTAGLVPGEYYVRANPPPGWTLKSVMWQGHDLSDTLIDLGTSDLTDVVVTFTDKPAAIAGDVAGADSNTPEPAAAVLVFPVDRDQWANYGISPRRFRSARASSDGTFRITGMPAGEYFMIAILDEQAANWQDPDKLAALARTAKQVQVRDGETSSSHLKVERIR